MSPTAVPSGKLGSSNSTCSANGLPGGNPSLEEETQLEETIVMAHITALRREMSNAFLKVENLTVCPAYWC
jgi:hypothetical protein